MDTKDSRYMRDFVPLTEPILWAVASGNWSFWQARNGKVKRDEPRAEDAKDATGKWAKSLEGSRFGP